MAQAKKKPIKTSVPKESSSEYFARIRPKFLDWNPPTPEEALAEVQKRKDDREAELRKVTALEKAKLAEKKSGKKKPVA
jgi:hypothetical protein